MLRLICVFEALPEGFDALRIEADVEGHRHMTRLVAEVSETPEMYIALLAAVDGRGLLGIGGMTVEPTDPGAIRMRRLYVARAARGQGVARAIANALLNAALGQTRLITVHAGNPGAGRFWEAMGFSSVTDQPWSHQFAAH